MLRTRQHELPYQDRRVHIHLKINRNEATFEIRDEGKGFNHAGFHVAMNADSDEHGRGLVLMKTFMDEVEFQGSGNMVRMVKRRVHS